MNLSNFNCNGIFITEQILQKSKVLGSNTLFMNSIFKSDSTDSKDKNTTDYYCEFENSKNISKSVISAIDNKNYDELINIHTKINKNNIINIYRFIYEKYEKNLEEIIQNLNINNEIKDSILKYLEKCYEDLYKYDSHYSATSQISNDFYKGNEYKIEQNGNKMVIINKTKNIEQEIDLNELVYDTQCIENKVLLKKTIQELPAEVIIDLFKETNLKIGISKTNRSYYDSKEDKILLSDSNISAKNIVHELGHALDYINHKGRNQNNSHYLKSKYKSGIKQFIKDGNEPYKEKWDSQKKEFIYIKGEKNAYCTWNENEMFAELYTLFMLGDCNSKEVIKKYFIEAQKEAKRSISMIRSLNPSIRHK